MKKKSKKRLWPLLSVNDIEFDWNGLFWSTHEQIYLILVFNMSIGRLLICTDNLYYLTGSFYGQHWFKIWSIKAGPLSSNYRSWKSLVAEKWAKMIDNCRSWCRNLPLIHTLYNSTTTFTELQIQFQFTLFIIILCLFF